MAHRRTHRRIRDEVAKWYADYYPSRGDAFCHVAMRIYFELDDDQALEACDVGGPGDRGVDAFWHDEEQREIVVVQAKYASRSKTFDRSVVADLESAWSALRHLSSQHRARAREQVLDAARQIRDARRTDPSYPVVLVCFAAGRFSPDAHSAVEAFNDLHQSEDVEMKLVDLEQLADAEELAETRDQSPPDNTETLELARAFSFSPGVNEPRTIVGVVDGVRLAEIERQYRYRIFQRNVRYFLTARQRYNRGIAHTLQTDSERSRFWYYNNGISIVCDELDVDWEDTDGPDAKALATIKNLQIVNGCQTTTTLGESLELLNEGSDFPAFVLVRIIEAPEEDLQARISLYNNRQNAVRDRDLQSNDDVQIRIQREFAQLDPPWFYARKRGEFDAIVRPSAPKRAKFNGRRLDNEAVAQAAYAFYRDPAVARARKANLFVRNGDSPEKGLYEEIFNDDTTAERLLLPYLLSTEIAKRRKLYMRELKDALSTGEPSLTQLDTRQLEWIKFADQIFLGVIGFYITQRVVLDDTVIAELLNPDVFEQVVERGYAYAEEDLNSFFMLKHQAAEDSRRPFVPANFVKGNWRDVLLHLANQERRRSRLRDDVFRGLNILSGP